MLRTHRARKGLERGGLRLNVVGGTQECLWPWKWRRRSDIPAGSLGPRWWGKL